MIDVLGKIIEDIGTKKEIISTLPVNTKKNRAIYVEKLQDIKSDYQKLLRNLLWQIKNSYEQIINDCIDVDAMDKQLSRLEKIERLKIVKDASDNIKTPYVKMGLDKVVHNLKRFYKRNLDAVNAEIKKCIELFAKVGINLTVKDFNFTPYVNQYMNKIFSEIHSGDFDSNAISAEFEEIYWKCPDIILHIQLNIRHIFLIKEGNIERFFKHQGGKLINEAKSDVSEIDKQYNQLMQEYLNENKRQPKTIIDRFLNGYYDVKDYEEKSIIRSYSKFINIEQLEREPENTYNNLIKLLHNLYEYRNYLRFKYIFDDVRKIYLEQVGKDEYKEIKSNIIKKGKVLSKSDKHMKDADREKTLNEISELYEKLDNIELVEEVHKHLNDKSTLRDMGELMLSFYRHTFMCIIQNNKDITENEINVEIEEFEAYIKSPYNIMSESLLILQEKDIALMIKDRYSLFDIKITKDALAENNLDNLILDLEKIENSRYIEQSGLQLKDITALCKMKKIIAENELN